LSSSRTSLLGWGFNFYSNFHKQDIASSFKLLLVFTTHVSVGSIFGIGTATKKADPSMVSKILLSWVLTLPVAAVVSAAVYWLMLQIF